MKFIIRQHERKEWRKIFIFFLHEFLSFLTRLTRHYQNECMAELDKGARANERKGAGWSCAEGIKREKCVEHT